MNRKNITILLASILLLSGCRLLNDPGNSKPNETNNGTVNVFFSARLPAGMKIESSSSRSASPAFDGDIKYNVKAEYAGTDGKNPADVERNGQGTSFNLPLVPGNWTVSVQGYSEDKPSTILFVGTKVITVEADISQPHSFTIQLQVNEITDSYTETGTVNLPVGWSTDSTIKKMWYQITGPSSTPMNESPLDATSLNINETLSQGLYTLTMLFLDDYNEVVYSLHSTVIVFAGLETNCWRSENEYDSEQEKIYITKELVERYRSRYIFVGENNTGNSEVGSYYSPYSSLKKAVERIRSISTGDTEPYMIFIKNDITETETLGDISDEIIIEPVISGESININYSSADSFAELKLSEKSLTLKNIKINNSVDCAVLFTSGKLILEGTSYIKGGIIFNTAGLCISIKDFSSAENTPISFAEDIKDSYGQGVTIINDTGDSNVSETEIGYFTIDSNSYDYVLGIKDGKGVLTCSSFTISTLPLYDVKTQLTVTDGTVEEGYPNIITKKITAGSKKENIELQAGVSVYEPGTTTQADVTYKNTKFTVYSAENIIESSTETQTAVTEKKSAELYLGTYTVLVESTVAGLPYSSQFILKVEE